MGSLSQQPSLNTSQRFFKQETVCSPSGSGAGFWVEEQMFGAGKTRLKQGVFHVDHDIIGKATQVKIGALGEVVLWEFFTFSHLG